MRFSMGTVLLAFLILFPASTRAITLGQVDTFENGVNQGWSSGTVEPGGGPGGSSDAFLQVSSNGSPGNSILSTTNTSSRWTRDYASAGVTAIEADLLNLGAVELDMRLLLMASNYGDFTSTQAFVLPPDGQWHHVRFGLSASDLTWGGAATGNLNGALHYVDTLILRHQSGAPLGIYQNTPIFSQLGIDNVQATPEPLSLLPFATAAMFFSGRRRWTLL